MRRRSSASVAEEEGEDTAPCSNADVTSVNNEAGGRSQNDNSLLRRASNDRQSSPRKENPQRLSHELDRRKSCDQRPSAARSRRPSNTNWKSAEIRNGHIEKASGQIAIIGVPSIDAISPEKMPDAQLIARRSRLRSPWSCSWLTFITTLLATFALFAIVHSFNNRQLETKGCRMSYMRPSFAKLLDFDTEHTRFASKYSVYLYREGGVDEDTKV